MSKLLRWLRAMLWAVVFLALLGFALNNQQDATVHLLFGRQWRAPMVLIVLAVFALGMVAGVLGMLPGWWSRRRAPPPADGASAAAPPPIETSPPAPPHGV
jgi:uncharacterized integral membrane protein